MIAGIAFTPQWVLCGSDLPDGRVRLLASKTMTHAELEVRADHAAPWDNLDTAPPVTSRRVTLTCGVRDFTLIDADDWPSAFADLFGEWAPGSGGRPAIGAIPAIGAP